VIIMTAPKGSTKEEELKLHCLHEQVRYQRKHHPKGAKLQEKEADYEAYHAEVLGNIAARRAGAGGAAAATLPAAADGRHVIEGCGELEGKLPPAPVAPSAELQQAIVCVTPAAAGSVPLVPGAGLDDENVRGNVRVEPGPGETDREGFVIRIQWKPDVFQVWDGKTYTVTGRPKLSDLILYKNTKTGALSDDGDKLRL
jgi:hypothetical protein